jgi:hypothetical protein
LLSRITGSAGSSASARLIAGPKPRLPPISNTRTSGSSRRASSTESSLEPLSTSTTSTGRV